MQSHLQKREHSDDSKSPGNLFCLDSELVILHYSVRQHWHFSVVASSKGSQMILTHPWETLCWRTALRLDSALPFQILKKTKTSQQTTNHAFDAPFIQLRDCKNGGLP